MQEIASNMHIHIDCKDSLKFGNIYELMHIPRNIKLNHVGNNSQVWGINTN